MLHKVRSNLKLYFYLHLPQSFVFCFFSRRIVYARLFHRGFPRFFLTLLHYELKPRAISRRDRLCIGVNPNPTHVPLHGHYYQCSIQTRTDNHAVTYSYLNEQKKKEVKHTCNGNNSSRVHIFSLENKSQLSLCESG